MRDKKPIHNQISDILRQRIAEGQYQDTGLPPELMLVKEFGVSRHTIRSALQRLVVDGLIERRAALGTTVTKRASNSAWLIGSIDEIVEYNVDLIRSIDARLIPAREAPHVAALFKTPLAGKVFRLVRELRTDAGLISSIAQVYTSAEIAARIPRSVVHKPLFFDHIQKYCGVRADRVRQVASATLADKDIADQLECRPGDPILVLSRTYISTDGEPLMFVELSCRPDRYQQTITFIQERGEVQDHGAVSSAPSTSAESTSHTGKRAGSRRKTPA